MSDHDLKIKALELANQHGAAHADVVARASAYHAFLSGAAKSAAPAAAKPAAPAAAAAAKPAAAKPAAPAAPKPAAKPAASPGSAKAPGGKYSQDQVRDMIRKVAVMPGEGKQSAMDILANDGGGVTNVSLLKPEFYDAVYEACSQILAEGGGDAGGAVEEEFDPTA